MVGILLALATTNPTNAQGNVFSDLFHDITNGISGIANVVGGGLNSVSQAVGTGLNDAEQLGAQNQQTPNEEATPQTANSASSSESDENKSSVPVVAPTKTEPTHESIRNGVEDLRNGVQDLHERVDSLVQGVNQEAADLSSQIYSAL